MSRTAEERQQVARIAAHTGAADPANRAAQAAGGHKSQDALKAGFLAQANGDEEAARHLYLAHLARLRLKSLRSRRLAREARLKAEELRLLIEAQDAEEALKQLGGGRTG